MRLTFASAIAKDLEMDERREEGVNIFYENMKAKGEFGAEVADKICKIFGDTFNRPLIENETLKRIATHYPTLYYALEQRESK